MRKVEVDREYTRGESGNLEDDDDSPSPLSYSRLSADNCSFDNFDLLGSGLGDVDRRESCGGSLILDLRGELGGVPDIACCSRLDELCVLSEAG